MWPRQHQNGLPRGKRVKSAEMHQLHEAFQYLLKRKALQVKVAFIQKGLMDLSFLQTNEPNYFPELKF